MDRKSQRKATCRVGRIHDIINKDNIPQNLGKIRSEVKDNELITIKTARLRKIGYPFF